MPEGFAGFQTQLSETFNKGRDKNDSLLEAFLDANGRLAFRFVDPGGSVISQPKVTTPGFIPSSLGAAPSTFPGTATPSISNGLASPTASGRLINDTGGGAPGGTGPGGLGDTSGSGTGGFGLANTAVSSEASNIAGQIARGLTPFSGIATKALSQISNQPVVEGPLVGMVSMSLSEAQAAAAKASKAGLGPLSGLDQSVVSNARSVAGLSGMSGTGTSGAASAGSGGTAGDASSDAGGGTGPGGTGGTGGGTGTAGSSASGAGGTAGDASADAGGGGAGGSGGSGGGSCFIKGTPITMKDFSIKPIENIKIDDKTLGGKVTGVMIFAGDSDSYNYDGTIVAGSHAVYENNSWVRIENSERAKKVNKKVTNWYVFNTTEHLIFINGVKYGDYIEIDHTHPSEIEYYKNAIKIRNAA